MHPTRRRRFTYTVPPEQDGWRLDAIVLDWLSGEVAARIAKAAVRKLIMAGAIRIHGRPTRRAGMVLSSGEPLDADVDVASIRRIRDAAERDAAPDRPVSVKVLYEDDELIAVSKPPGLPTHATADPGRLDLYSLVRRLLAARSTSPHAAGAPPYLGLHHRLDADTSGVVLFTKRETANAGLARQFAEGLVEKTYHAVTGRRAGKVQRSWRVDNSLAAGGGRRARMASVQNGGVHAVTAFRLVRGSRVALLIEARPQTGRKHQIRAHLAGEGLPILGDTRYGGATRVGSCAVARTMLHACRLTLAHPITGARLSIAADYPADFAHVVACLFGRQPATIPGR